LSITTPCKPAHSEDTVGNWVYLGKSSEGTDFAYHGKTLQKSGMPPNLISAKMYSMTNGKSAGWNEHEFNCETEELKILPSSQKFNLRSEQNSLRKMWLKGFCGIKQDDGYWFLVGSLQAPHPNPAFYGWLFIDANSIRKIDSPIKNGTGFRISYGSFDLLRTDKVRAENGIFEGAIDCNNPTKILSKTPTANEFTESAVNSNDVSGTYVRLVCESYFPVFSLINESKDSHINNESIDKSVDKAKEQCKELGFSPGTEKYGTCVLKLSK
jgi:hypothetical protein